MPHLSRFFGVVLLMLGIVAPASALVPLESILLGDFTQKYSTLEKDPIEYIFEVEKNSHKTLGPEDKNFKAKRELVLYRGFYQEGDNLKNFCSGRPKILYPDSWDREQVKRSIVSTLQYIGLDLTIRALPSYAHYFEFSKEEFSNMASGLVKNYCSQNLTLISLKQLEKAFINKYDKASEFKTPSFKENPLFPSSLSKINDEEDMMKREFFQTIELFKSFCSWGGDVKNLRLLVPLIRHPAIYEFLVRQLSGQKLNWNFVDNRVFKKPAEKSVQVHCRNLICRKTELNDFIRNTPKGAGSTSLSDDFNRLYCEDFRDVDFTIQGQVPKLREMIKSQSFDDQNLLVAQFISLLTGVPDLMVRLKKFDDGINVLRASMDESWDSWAKDQNENYQRSFYFEESLTMDLVNNKYYFEPTKRKFLIHFDVNMGEFDRSNQIVGKLSTNFKIKLPKKFLLWARNIWRDLDPRDKKANERLVNRFKTEVQNDLDRVQGSTKRVLWKGDLAKLITYELLDQITKYRGKFYEQGEAGLVEIPIYFNYGPFALQYIRYQYLVKKNNEKAAKRKKQLLFGLRPTP